MFEVNILQELRLPLPKRRIDLSALVNNYIFYQLGMNIWADLENIIEEDDILNITLNGTIPNHLNPFSQQKKKIFMYTLLNVGEVQVNKTNRRIEKITKAKEMDIKIYEEFWKLHRHVDEVVRSTGKEVWGKLNFNQTFLRPYYSYISHLLIEDEIDLQFIINNKREKWLYPLLESGYISIHEEKSKIIPGNSLLAFIDEDINYLEIPSLVVGDLIAQHSEYLYNELQVRSFRKYIDITNTYYFLAVDYGELIPIERKEIYSYFGKFGNRPLGYSEEISLQVIINELISAGMLQSPNKELILGEESIFNEIMPYRSQIMENTLEITLENYVK